MQIVDANILHSLKKPSPESHKGDNGRILVIAGSEKYHGAMLLAIQAASRLVDVVYVYTWEGNRRLVEQLKSEIAVFIAIGDDELWEKVEQVDAILIGPGLAEDKNTKKILEKILTQPPLPPPLKLRRSRKLRRAKKYYPQNIIVDATAAWMVNSKLLHKNCVVTPHKVEFEHLFNCEPIADNVLKMAKYYQCVVALKGKYDYISDGKELYENSTGNVGMTKGGTGDVLAGLICGFAAKNDLLTSTLAGIYLNGLAGDKLFEKRGTFYNAEDVVGELGSVFKQI